jgi:hypothetical protein
MAMDSGIKNIPIN